MRDNSIIHIFYACDDDFVKYVRKQDDLRNEIMEKKSKLASERDICLDFEEQLKIRQDIMKHFLVSENDVFMLCSDGFRHEITEEEMFGVIAPPVLTSEKVMKKSLMDLIELNKSRNEKDNITALLVKAIH